MHSSKASSGRTRRGRTLTYLRRTSVLLVSVSVDPITIARGAVRVELNLRAYLVRGDDAARR